MINVRNPWGGGQEWSGAWHDDDENWAKISDDEKKAMGHSDAEDGYVWEQQQEQKQRAKLTGYLEAHTPVLSTFVRTGRGCALVVFDRLGS